MKSSAFATTEPPRHAPRGVIRPDITHVPNRIHRLPLNHQGFPVPWFVAWVPGDTPEERVPDFRVIAPGKRETALKRRLCWVCGGKLTRHAAFVIGPMCTVNRVSAEPPSHRECAEFSATYCPFLSNPRMRRNEKNLPEDAQNPGGVMIERNPGATAIWITKHWQPFGDGDGGWLLRIGDPTQVLWYAEGRAATRDQVMASIESGLPLLREHCKSKADVASLDKAVSEAMTYVPAA